MLKDILYSVTGSHLSTEYQDMELILYPEVEAKFYISSMQKNSKS